MENRRTAASRATFVLLSACALVLGGCGGLDLGGLGGGNSGSASANSGEISGVVDRVDTRDKAIVIETSGYSSTLRDGRSGLVAIYYDDQTVVAHEGQGYPPEALERGDRITALVEDVNGRPFTRQIRVDYDSSPYDDGGGTWNDTNTNTGSSWGELTGRGTVRWVDTRSRTVEVEDVTWASNNSTTRSIVLDYDDRTRLEMNNRAYAISNLERGDYVEFRATDDRRPYVSEIRVLRDSRTTTGTTSSWGADLRGTVSYVDTRNRYIDLSRGNERWSSNFATGSTGVSNDTARIYYSSATVVEYQGQNYKPENLERGDVVDVWTETVNGRLYTERLVVVQDVNQRY